MSADIVTLPVRTFTLPLPPVHSDDWYAMRAPYVGASEVAALFGSHPYKTLAQLAAEKQGGEGEPENDAMRLGTALEPIIAERWEADHGVRLLMPEVAYGRGGLLANPDRLVLGSDTDHLEVKFTFDAVARPKRHWWFQAQAQMACMGTERCHFAVWDAEGFKSFVVFRDEAVVAEIDAAVACFWEYVNDGLEPPTFGRQREERTLKVAEREATLIADWRQAKEVASFHEEEVKRLRGEVESFLGLAGLEPKSKLSVLGPDGTPLLAVRMQKGRAGLDKEGLRSYLGDAYEQFETEGEPFPVVTEVQK